MPKIPDPLYWQKLRQKSLKEHPLKRTPLKRSSNPIKKRSDKRAKQDGIYNRRVKIWKIENPYCKARLAGCTGLTADCHHMAGKIGKLLTDENNWLPVCRNCHNWITENSKEAIEKGLSKKRIN